MPLFKKQNLLTVGDQLFLENCKLMYQVVMDLCAKPLKCFFIKLNSYQTRSSCLHVIKHSLSKVNKSFLCKAIMDWDTLTAEEKKSTNVKMQGYTCRYAYNL